MNMYCSFKTMIKVVCLIQMESMVLMRDFPSSILKPCFYSPLILDTKSHSWLKSKESSLHHLVFHVQMCSGRDHEKDLMNSSSDLE